jgi:hypothetical protein
MKKNGEVLAEMLENAVVTGEVPYQANRRAMRAFDVLEDVDKGNSEIEVVLNGIDEFVNDLQEVGNAARNVASRASSFL